MRYNAKNLQTILSAAIHRANENGFATAKLSGVFELTRTVFINSYASGTLPRLTGCLTVDATEATVVHNIAEEHQPAIFYIGDYRFEGRNGRLNWIGGGFQTEREQDSTVAIRTVDARGCTFAPYLIEGFDVGIESTIGRSWSENNVYGDATIPLFSRRNKRLFRFLGRREAEERYGAWPDPYEGKIKFESFAGTRIQNVVMGGVKDPSVHGLVIQAIDASLYRSSITNIFGNVPNGGGSLLSSNNAYWRGTTIDGWALEGANRKGPVSAILHIPQAKASADRLGTLTWLHKRSETIVFRQETRYQIPEEGVAPSEQMINWLHENELPWEGDDGGVILRDREGNVTQIGYPGDWVVRDIDGRYRIESKETDDTPDDMMGPEFHE